MSRQVYPKPDIPNGMYLHHKGGVYEVFGLAELKATSEWMVLYRNPFSGLQFTRPAAEWQTPVANNVNRFKPYPKGQPL